MKNQFNQVFQIKFPCINNFQEAKAIYESITPLKGKRAAMDIRPLSSDRKQTRFQIHKIHKNEYSVVGTYVNALGRYGRQFKGEWIKEGGIKRRPNWECESMTMEHRQMLSYHRNGTIKIHCPVGMRQMTGQECYDGGTLWRQPMTNQVANLLSQALPSNMWIKKVGRWKAQTKWYLAIQHKDRIRYYLLPDQHQYVLRIDPTADGDWQVANPIQEFRQHIPKTVWKPLKTTFRKFTKYATNYWHLCKSDTWDIPDIRGIGSPTDVIPLMDSDPWKALSYAKSRTFVVTNTPEYVESFLPPEVVLPLWLRMLRKDFYNRLSYEEFQYDPCPIGEICYRHRGTPFPMKL